ncbi:hypothetical protein C0991_000749 [Blastosporella zonata]|nr:hypothetical protein C0991_000749 [Blastosporella zonata]
MPPNHELQLMLVNTLRKDLEHDDIPRISLALDNVIASSNDDLVPAIQTRLRDLLSHNSPHVRRRALLAYRSFAFRHADSLSSLDQKVATRCKDSDPQVAGAALALCVRMTQASSLMQYFTIDMPVVNARELVNDLLNTTLNRPASYNPGLVTKILAALRFVG